MTGCRAPRGFTLIELLVVIVIVAALAAVAVLSIGSGDATTLRSEAQRLQQLLMLARDEAMYRYKNYGLLQDEASYQLQVYNNVSGKWETPAGQLFKRHWLPAPLRLSITVEGELVLPEEESGKSADTLSTEASHTLKPPQLLMLTSGETTAFEIRLRAAEHSPLSATLSSDGFSPVTLVYHNGSP